MAEDAEKQRLIDEAYAEVSKPKPEHPEYGRVTSSDAQCQWCGLMYKTRNAKMSQKRIPENMARYGASTGECSDCSTRYHELIRRHGYSRAYEIMRRRRALNRPADPKETR